MVSFAVSIPQHGTRAPEGIVHWSRGQATWAFHEEADALRFADALRELEPEAGVEVRSDHVFRQLGLAWMIALSARIDGARADSLAWQAAYRGALDRREQMQVVLPPEA